MTLFKSKTWKWIRNGFIAMILFIILVFGAAFSVIYFYEDEITKYAIEQLAKDLNTEVTIESVDLTLVKTFPDASIIFNNIKAKDATTKYKKGTLFNASELYLSFNFWDIFSEKYNIKRIKINDGSINIKLYPDGSNNYKLFKPTRDTTSSKFAFQLKRVLLNNVSIIYQDAPAQVKINLLAHRLIFKGKFSEKVYALNIDANLDFEEFQIQKHNYFNQKGVELELLMNVVNNKNFEFDKSLIKIADQKFSIAGRIERQDLGTYADLKIKGSDLDINNLFKQIPEGTLEDVKALNGEGEMYFDAIIKGYIQQSPAVTVNFGIRGGSIENKKNNIKLDQIDLTGRFSNGAKRNLFSSTLELRNFKASMNYGNISGSLYIHNFKQPSIKLDGEAAFNLGDIQNLLQIDTIESISGTSKIKINYNGTLSQFDNFTKDDFLKSVCDGKIIIENSSVKFKKNSLPFNNINASFDFNNNDLAIESLMLNVGKSDFNIKGNIKNFIPYLLIPNQALNVDASIKSENINLDELLANQNSNNNSSKAYNLELSKDFDFNINFSASKFIFRRFEASNTSAGVVIRSQKCLINDLSLSSMGGNIKLDGTLDATSQNAIIITADAHVNKVDVKKMFYQFENFGQTGILDNNIKGIVNSDIQLHSTWSKSLEADLDKLQVSCTISIDQGELNNFAPLKGLSKFIKADELENVKFATLRNTIEIKNRTITIPKMDIATSALNLSAAGSHTFDNKIDYRIELLLSDVLWNKMKKAKKENEDFGQIEDDGLGKTKLFIRIYGTTSNPQFAYDKKGVKEKIKQDLKNEKQNLKQILNDEFGWFKKDSALKKQQEKTTNTQFSSPTNNSKTKEREKKKKEELEDGFKVEW